MLARGPGGLIVVQAEVGETHPVGEEELVSVLLEIGAQHGVGGGDFPPDTILLDLVEKNPLPVFVHDGAELRVLQRQKIGPAVEEELFTHLVHCSRQLRREEGGTSHIAAGGKHGQDAVHGDGLPQDREKR